MKRIVRLLLLAAATLLCSSSWGALNILATTPEWAALASEIGGDKVNVYSATTALQDPHRVEAKPSLVARTRNADLLIATGAELEIGWLPLAQRESGNAKIQVGSPGYFEAARLVRMLEVPAAVDRSMGDVHPFGNPHIHTNPHNIGRVGEALAKRLGEIDPANRDTYETRNKSFQERWRQAIGKWEAQAAPLKGSAVLVIHKDQEYLIDWLGLKNVGSLEPRPGVPPTTGHLSELLQRLEKEPAKAILRSAYANPRAAEWMAERGKLPVVVMPYTVGGSPAAKDLFTLFDDTIARLAAAIK
jgi:zinc/manganese transport system substrate-binding protein